MYRAISRWRNVRVRRSVASARGWSPYLLCLYLLALKSGAVSAQTAPVSAQAQPASAQTPLPRAPQGVVARPDLTQGHPSEEALRKFREAQQELLAKHQRAARSASARGAIGRVTVAARCVESFVVNGTHRASAEDVKIVAAEPRECNGDRCRTYEVTAVRDSTQPFDLEVSATCS